MLGNDPNKQAIWLKPRAGVDKPSVFKPAIGFVAVVGWVEEEEVVGVAVGDEVLVAVMEDMACGQGCR